MADMQRFSVEQPREILVDFFALRETLSQGDKEAVFGNMFVRDFRPEPWIIGEVGVPISEVNLARLVAEVRARIPHDERALWTVAGLRAAAAAMETSVQAELGHVLAANPDESVQAFLVQVVAV